ncbi:inorganic diphosphatase, putative [Ichthyophthirius multifiliis]|uniref:Inorganic pyrophosphatase n=1 Tax=Ichthyophthirius multifiliis TaxID=5932 RepID=G0R0K5_ICHMU|nr:inorganic diphosphatase, putative [Ichthyophthirius multifiliis]EGR28991.1 inorganic diphosphatase, putative [Ichthyophthirius multifiliis]|eukprot:XP_004030227.1 inorganic diphosphatase, putative [Ichthyophthirius multifiliis]
MIHKYSKNPWHYVSYGTEVPHTVTAVIEISKGSKAKYELDKESGMLKLDRVLFSAVHYPANYGFIPQTYCDDKDPLDILVICSIDVEPLCLVDAKVIGVMHMIDGGQIDDKIIAVAANDSSVNHYNDIHDLPQYLTKQIERFFEDYKKLEKKDVKVQQCEGKEVAFKVIEESIKLYQQEYGYLHNLAQGQPLKN